MIEIVGIQFKNASRVYYFAPQENKFKVNDFAIVETIRGLELGKVIIENRLVEDSEIEYELKPVIRRATKFDLDQEKKHQEQAPKSFEIFKKFVKQLNLPMKPLYCEYTIDHSKILFYYTSDERVDFRELLKLLTPEFHLRIELRQIGPREAARIIGGVGCCGRIVCCKSCLSNFDFVTMKMAKEQGMSLNTNKISGTCGKLMCCISYEQEIYNELKKELPPVGSYVKTPNCQCAKIVSIDYIKKVLKTQEGDNVALTSYKVSDVKPVVVKDPNKEAIVSNTIVENSDQEIKKEDEVKKEASNEKDPKPKGTTNKKEKKTKKFELAHSAQNKQRINNYKKKNLEKTNVKQ